MLGGKVSFGGARRQGGGRNQPLTRQQREAAAGGREQGQQQGDSKPLAALRGRGRTRLPPRQLALADPSAPPLRPGGAK
ncbi:MAG: hypothetical protein WDW38_006685 [Sanguina aurantia]